VFAATGKGFDEPQPLTPRATYRVPADRRAQTIYFRAGNASPELISLVLLREGVAMRHFPIGAKSAMHVALAVLEDLSPETTIEVQLAAPPGQPVTLVLDVGFMEVSS
jgi:hypothetical protein